MVPRQLPPRQSVLGKQGASPLAQLAEHDREHHVPAARAICRAALGGHCGVIRQSFQFDSGLMASSQIVVAGGTTCPRYGQKPYIFQSRFTDITRWPTCFSGR
jgi:hypothetical protein